VKKYWIITFCLLPLILNAQIITTFAGGGTVSLGDGGQATAAIITDPGGCVFDKYGNFYVVSGYGGNRIRKINNVGIIVTVAGTGVGGYAGDGGQATAAELNLPEDIIVDTLGNIYFSETTNNAIRKVEALTGIITTICGRGTVGSTGDGGPATAAYLDDPNGLCFDKFGNLYIADLENNRVRKINTSGVITNFAGNGIYGFSGDGGPATSAQLWVPWNVTADDTGNIYISDRGNFRIRKVNTAGVISTFAGDGSDAFTGDGIPATNAQFSPDFIRMDTSNKLYIGDNINNRVLMIDHSSIIHNVAGDGGSLSGIEGDGGPATAAVIYYPTGLAFDACGNLYIGDVDNNRVRKVSINSSCSIDSLDSVATLSVCNINVSAGMMIYPNPATDEITIEARKAISKITISNMMGQVVYEQECKTKNLDLNIGNLPNGIYFVGVVDDEGNKTVRKIVKE
jgi:hypothetical protein